MLRVYLAAPYQMKEQIALRAKELRALGMIVTSQWLEEKYDPTVQLGDVSRPDRADLAKRDVDDIAAADVLVLQPDITGLIKRQGRTVELGIAIGLRRFRPMEIFIVGSGEENIFYDLPGVKHFNWWYETKDALFDLMGHSA